ncbi:MAG: signal peptidase I [Paracoccaceae bacterium]|jgi:signal peptidase I
MADIENKQDGIVDWIKTIVYALLLAGVIRTIFFQPFWIPSGSMKETLLIGDFLFVNKMAYGYSKHSCPFSMCPISGRILGSEPDRGDVVVFKHPVSKVDFIKRLIGLPGDKVQMKNGLLYINDVAVKTEPGGTFDEVYDYQGSQRGLPQCENGTLDFGEVCKKTRTIETLPNGVSHSTLSIVDGGRGDNTKAFTVPAGEYFFMGDNRDNSLDSRFGRPNGVGFVPFENLVGRADRVVFSSAGRSILAFWTWRSDRFFKAIK